MGLQDKPLKGCYALIKASHRAWVRRTLVETRVELLKGFSKRFATSIDDGIKNPNFPVCEFESRRKEQSMVR